LLSALLYGIDFLVFRDAHTLFLYLMSSLAFLPLEIFIVVLIIERIVDQSERKVKLQKLNMVLGAFFNDVGNHLLRGCWRISITKPKFPNISISRTAGGKRNFSKPPIMPISSKLKSTAAI